MTVRKQEQGILFNLIVKFAGELLLRWGRFYWTRWSN